MRFLIVLAAACGSSTPSAQTPPVATTHDAAIDATAPPDAGLPADVTSAPPWIFRYNAPGRLETWTLRYHGGVAAMDVESATGTLHYVGTATETTSLALVLAAGSARLSLDCKHEQRAIAAACGDKRQPKQDVLACYHPDFKEPMPFGPAPGVEYLSSAACTGYHRL
ncbi:MAG TPA: hypothetical protein VGG74_33160 [Kofleriaceae bacterium]|jgi:hypothetical protein